MSKPVVFLRPPEGNSPRIFGYPAQILDPSQLLIFPKSQASHRFPRSHLGRSREKISREGIGIQGIDRDILRIRKTDQFPYDFVSVQALFSLQDVEGIEYFNAPRFYSSFIGGEVREAIAYEQNGLSPGKILNHVNDGKYPSQRFLEPTPFFIEIFLFQNGLKSLRDSLDLCHRTNVFNPHLLPHLQGIRRIIEPEVSGCLNEGFA